EDFRLSAFCVFIDSSSSKKGMRSATEDRVVGIPGGTDNPASRTVKWASKIFLARAFAGVSAASALADEQRRELVGRDGLHEVLVEAARERLFPIRGLPVPRERDEPRIREVRIGAEATRDLEAVHARQT